MAEVSPRSKEGLSLFEVATSLTAEHVEAFGSQPDVIVAASSELKR